MSVSFYLNLGLEMALIYVVSTISFDVVHYLLHRFAKSKYRFLQRLGDLHETHHRWFGPNLRHVDELAMPNLMHHRIPEYLNQVAVTGAFLLVANPLAVALVAVVHTVALVFVLCWRGVDMNHQKTVRLKHPRGHFFVTPSYHYLHHVHNDSHMGSFVQVFDWIMGSCVHLKGQRVAMTGASGAYGSAMKNLLERAGAIVTPLKYGVDYDYADYGRVHDVLRNADILVLAHGSKVEDAMAANCDSFVALIELFRSLTQERLVPPQVWAMGSEIECHPTFGVSELAAYAQSKRAYARYARNYNRAEDILYRHIVTSAFTSRMGRGLMSAKAAAWLSLWLIKRGFRYVPVTYTGVALLNFGLFVAGDRIEAIARLGRSVPASDTTEIVAA